MSDQEIRAALRDLHDSVMPLVTPPGVAKARRTLRHRRVTRAALAAAFAIALGVAAVTAPRIVPPPPSNPPTTPVTTPSVDPSATPTAAPTSTPPTTTTPAGSQAGGIGPLELTPYFLLYGDNLSTSVGQSGSSSVPLGVEATGRGTFSNVVLRADFSQISGSVDVVGATAPCSQSGSMVTCDFGTVTVNGPKEVGASVSLRGRPDALLGRDIGRVRLTVSADPAPNEPSRTSGPIYVYPSVADLAISSTVPTAQIGQTVTVSYTVTNQGPASEPSARVFANGVQPGTQYVGGAGCTTTTTTFDCQIDNLGVGETRVVSVNVLVNGCVPSGDTTSAGATWETQLPDPNDWNNNVQMMVRVQGCP